MPDIPESLSRLLPWDKILSGDVDICLFGAKFSNNVFRLENELTFEGAFE